MPHSATKHLTIVERVEYYPLFLGNLYLVGEDGKEIVLSALDPEFACPTESYVAVINRATVLAVESSGPLPLEEEFLSWYQHYKS